MHARVLPNLARPNLQPETHFMYADEALPAGSLQHRVDMKDTNTRKDGEDIDRASKCTQDVIAKLFENLKTGAAVKADGQPRLFFPNGIELIDVTVDAGVKSGGIKITVKVAGEKGIKGTDLLSSTSDQLFPGGPDDASEY